MKKHMRLAWWFAWIALVVFVASSVWAAPVFIPQTDAPTSENGDGLGAPAQTTSNVPALDTFIAAVKNGKSEVAGLYVPQVLALRVVQQPADNPAYVSPMLGTVTSFNLAATYGTMGLLAHNYLSGATFHKLGLGQEVALVFGDGSVRRYAVKQIRRFQALSPANPYSSFVDLDNGGAPISSTELFHQIYAQGNQVVLQTCINALGDWSWGRLFVIATPIQ